MHPRFEILEFVLAENLVLERSLLADVALGVVKRAINPFEPALKCSPDRPGARSKSALHCRQGKACATTVRRVNADLRKLRRDEVGDGVVKLALPQGQLKIERVREPRLEERLAFHVTHRLLRDAAEQLLWDTNDLGAAVAEDGWIE